MINIYGGVEVLWDLINGLQWEYVKDVIPHLFPMRLNGNVTIPLIVQNVWKLC